ncbi:hypothetical protein Tco_0079463 [Tanacetum coccineum]
MRTTQACKSNTKVIEDPTPLSWKPCQEFFESTGLQLKSDSLPHAHAQVYKDISKHQDSRIMKAQELKDKRLSAKLLKLKITSSRNQASGKIGSKLSR